METTEKDMETERQTQKKIKEETPDRRGSRNHNIWRLAIKVIVTCFHPQSLRDVALLWRSLSGGCKRGNKDGCRDPWGACSGDRGCKYPSAGLSPQEG